MVSLISQLKLAHRSIELPHDGSDGSDDALRNPDGMDEDEGGNGFTHGTHRAEDPPMDLGGASSHDASIDDSPQDETVAQNEDETSIAQIRQPSGPKHDVDTADPAVAAPLRPYCLVRFAGQTSNRVLILAKLLAWRGREGKGRPIALNERWTDWYLERFDERDEFIYNHTYEGCHVKMWGKHAFFLKVNFAPYLSDFLPKKAFREEADAYVDAWVYGRNYVSAHRRNLDGNCISWAKCKAGIVGRKCLSTSTCTAADRVNACNMEYSMLDEPPGSNVVLFTDKQVPELDGTFPIHFNASSVSDFLVEVLIMTKSTTHWGNPLSSVDVLVHHWRMGVKTQPQQCQSMWQNYMDPSMLKTI